jgi:hypothetical protein
LKIVLVQRSESGTVYLKIVLVQGVLTWETRLSGLRFAKPLTAVTSMKPK